MDQQAYDLILAMPPDVDYASLPRDLGIEDIPWERVPGLTALMRGNDSYVALDGNGSVQLGKQRRIRVLAHLGV